VISKIKKDNIEILVLDYSDCNEDQMIAIAVAAKPMILSASRPLAILSVFNDRAYATPKFVMALKKETAEVIHLIDRQAVVGLNDTKKIILKGFNFLFRINIKAFDTTDAALQFLVEDSKSYGDIPDYLRK
jgi:hypothetical protein